LKFDDQAAAELVYAMRHTPAELRQVLRQGRAAFAETASAEVLDALTAQQFQQVAAFAMECFSRSFVTQLNIEPAPDPNGTVFTAPPAGTVSVGGSTTSVHFAPSSQA
jgi:hypothetical protein